MKKTYPVSQKAREHAKHLKPFGKRRANGSTRRILKAEIPALVAETNWKARALQAEDTCANLRIELAKHDPNHTL